MNELTFQHLESLHWVWLVLAIALLSWYGWRRKRAALAQFATPTVWDHLLPRRSLARQWARVGLIFLACLSLVVALLDPRWGVRYEQLPRRGIDILFVVDVSRSMLAEDVKPNRLERAKQYVRDVVDELGGDRVGLISFAGIAALKCPLTIDYGALRLSLNELAPESAARGGSLLGDALRLAGESFTEESKDARIVVVLSDGDDQASYPIEAAQKLRGSTGARVFTVGLGDANEGARIPVADANSRARTFLTYQGQEVRSKMNAEILREISVAGDGAFVRAGIDAVDLGLFYRERIAPLGTEIGATSRIEIRTPRFQWFAGFALALLLIESWMSDRKPVRTPFPPKEDEA